MVSEVGLLRICFGPPTGSTSFSTSFSISTATSHLGYRGAFCLSPCIQLPSTRGSSPQPQRSSLLFQALQVSLSALKRSEPSTQPSRPHPAFPILLLQAPYFQAGSVQGFPPTWPADSSRPQAAARPSLQPLIPPKTLILQIRGGQETLGVTQ